MPRPKAPHRLDHIADAATEVFIQHGYGPSRIAEIAAKAKVGPGTIYLYAEGKEALFDLAIRRSLEDPSVWTMVLPHPNPRPGAVGDALWRCLQNAAHFPQLWLATESPPPVDVREEVEGIIRELYRWLHRYRRGIKLVERCGGEWPELSQVFYRRFWRGGVRRLADYLQRRTSEGFLPRRPDHLAAAHLVIESLTWMAAHREWAPGSVQITESTAEETALGMLVPAICSE
jgi:AcrR family transcriptional regulator